MKIILVVMMILSFAGTSLASSVSGLPEATAVTSDDLLLITDSPAASPASKKITITNFFASVPTAITVSASGDSYISWTNNSGGRAPTASAYEIYVDAGVFKVNQNGTEYTPAYLDKDNSFTAANTFGDGGDDQKVVMRINASDGNWSGMTLYFAQCAASLAFGTPVYVQSTGKPAAADADAAATMPAIGLIVVASTDADTPCTVLTHGVITETTWDWTAGNTIYVADGDAGALTATVGDISDTNDVVQVIGIALSGDSVFVNPSLTTVVLE